MNMHVAVLNCVYYLHKTFQILYFSLDRGNDAADHLFTYQHPHLPSGLKQAVSASTFLGQLL